MRVLVLGGTGAIGTQLIKELTNDAHHIFVTSRKERKSLVGEVYIQGDALNDVFIEKLLDNNFYDVIIDFMNYSTEKFMCRIELMLRSTSQYIFLSSGRVYSHNNEEILNETRLRLLDDSEDYEFLETDEYSLAKARQEDILFGCKHKNWVIIRPYITYNMQRLQLGIYEKEQWLYRALRGRPIVFSDDIASKVTTMTNGSDVAKLISSLVGKENVMGEVFLMASNQSVKWQDILQVYRRVLEDVTGKTPTIFMAKHAIVMDYSKYQYKYDRVINRRFESAKILSFNNDEFIFCDVFEGLESCLRSSLQEGVKFERINWEYEARMDRLSGCKTSLLEMDLNRERLIYLVHRYIPLIYRLYAIVKKRIK